MALLDETVFSSVAKPVSIRACRRYVDLRATLRSTVTFFYHTYNMYVLASSYTVTRNGASSRTCSGPVPPASELALVGSSSSNEEFRPAYIVHQSSLPLGPH